MKGTYVDYVFWLEVKVGLELLGDHGDVGASQVDLVDHGDDVQTPVERVVEVRDRLSLDSLRRIHQQQCALTSSDGATDLIGEVNVARSVNEVEQVLLIFVHVEHTDGLSYDCDSSFFFDLKICELELKNKEREVKEKTQEILLAV